MLICKILLQINTGSKLYSTVKHKNEYYDHWEELALMYSIRSSWRVSSCHSSLTDCSSFCLYKATGIKQLSQVRSEKKTKIKQFKINHFQKSLYQLQAHIFVNSSFFALIFLTLNICRPSSLPKIWLHRKYRTNFQTLFLFWGLFSPF
jgi:hypothetical protein